jgi:DNA-binding SARP family transcriptional activator
VQGPRTAAASADARLAGGSAGGTDGARGDGGAGRVSLRLLNGFELRWADESVALPMAGQRLLAFLALEAGPVHRAHAVSKLWFAKREAHAHASLRSTLWRLQHRCPAPVVESTRTHLSIARDAEVDVREQVGLARQLLDPSAEALPPADLALLEGELLPEWRDEWLLRQRDRLRQLRLHALEALSESLVSRRRYGEAVEAAFAALAADPLRESAHRVLIRSYLAEGNFADALDQYRRCQELLRSRLGVGPSPELLRLGDELTRCGCTKS